jgi:hypothetical protein
MTKKRFSMTQTAVPTIWTIANAALKGSFLPLDNGMDLIFPALKRLPRCKPLQNIANRKNKGWI